MRPRTFIRTALFIVIRKTIFDFCLRFYALLNNAFGIKEFILKHFYLFFSFSLFLFSLLKLMQEQSLYTPFQESILTFCASN